MPASKRISGQRGSVMIYIFIGILLFAALAFSFSRGFQSTSGTLAGQQKASVVAAELIAYSNMMERAVQALLLKGCSEEQISFERPNLSGYANANAPPDKSCHVFDANGGKVVNRTFLSLNNNAIDNPQYMLHIVPGLGTGKVDLLMKFKILNGADICSAINKTIQPSWATLALPKGYEGANNFNGTIVEASYAEVFIPGTLATYQGREALCYDYFIVASPPPYFYYRALIVR